jgi:hypothetical protein
MQSTSLKFQPLTAPGGRRPSGRPVCVLEPLDIADAGARRGDGDLARRFKARLNSSLAQRKMRAAKCHRGAEAKRRQPREYA